MRGNGRTGTRSGLAVQRSLGGRPPGALDVRQRGHGLRGQAPRRRGWLRVRPLRDRGGDGSGDRQRRRRSRARRGRLLRRSRRAREAAAQCHGRREVAHAPGDVDGVGPATHADPARPSDGQARAGDPVAPARERELSRSEKEKMLAGELYFAGDPELVADRAYRARLMRALDEQPDEGGRVLILNELFAAFGEGSEIRSPFFCDYGFNITIGAGVFVNFNCVILDVVPVTIGNRVQVGPAVQMLAADHPTGIEERGSLLENGRPITVEDDVWIGGAAVLLPGVTVGAESVIGA